jgi:tripartite-type tricarboxylate transporter receptor subunit TctC
MQNYKYYQRAALGAVAGAFMAATAFGSASAAEFPERDITFVVPYSPGGGSDQQARRLQAGMEKHLGVGVRIVYKTGGGGAVGFLELHSSKPDGYTIANVVVPNIIVTSKGDNVGFKPADFSYAAMTVTAPGAFVVPKQSKFKTLKEVIDFAKANPGKLTVAGVGASGLSNYAVLVEAFGIEATYVPVSGGVGKIMPLLQGGHVDAATLSSSHATRHKETVRALVVAHEKGVPGLPDVPSADSLGYPKFKYATTWGIMLPPGTPDDIVAKINEAVNAATADPKVRAMQVKVGMTPLRLTPQEARQLVMDNIAGVENKAMLIKKHGLDKK